MCVIVIMYRLILVLHSETLYNSGGFKWLSAEGTPFTDACVWLVLGREGGLYGCRATGHADVPMLSRPRLLCVHNAGDYPPVSGRVSSLRTGQGRGWKLEHSWESVSHTDVSNRHQTEDKRAVQLCTAVMCYDPRCLSGWNASKTLRTFF